MIAPTVAALADLAPSVVVPAHCTGWREQQHLPDAFVANSVGTRDDLTST